jgi:hypothetical protein
LPRSSDRKIPVSVPVILRERANVLAHEIVDDRPERLAVIVAHPDVRRVVVEPMVVDGDEHGAVIIQRGHDLAHERARREHRDVLRDVLPRLAGVA